MFRSRCLRTVACALGVIAAGMPVQAFGSTPSGIGSRSHAVCFDASHDSVAGGVVSQTFQKSYKSHSSAAAGAFILGAACTVSEVDVLGRFADGTTALKHTETLTIYGDSGDDFPGKKIAAVTGLKGTLDASGNLAVPLGKQRITLQPGIYWVSVQLKTNYSPGGRGVLWQWETTDTQTGYPGSWQNPANGTGQGCTSWTPINGCFLNNGVGLLFAVFG